MTMIKILALIAVIGMQSPTCVTTEIDLELSLLGGSSFTKISLTGIQADVLIKLINDYPPSTEIKGSYLVMYGFREGGDVKIFMGSGPQCINHSISLRPRVFVVIMNKFFSILREVGGDRSQPPP